MPQFIVNCSDNLDKFNVILNEISPKSIVIFTGGKSYNSLTCKASLDLIFNQYKHIIFSNIKPNPSIEDIETAKYHMEKATPDLLISIGGGSVIDTAKSSRYLSEKFAKTPHIAIPTTAGTGSESTQFATYYKGKIKNSFDNKSLLPNYVILSHLFTETLPSTIAANTGADALCQAIESGWNVHSTDNSREIATAALVKIVKNLEKSVINNDADSRHEMLIAANLAGQAINITRTTACHSISYPITSHFGIPHGQAVSISLPELLIYNYNINANDCCDARGIYFVKRRLEELLEILGVNTVTQAKNLLHQLFLNIG